MNTFRLFIINLILMTATGLSAKDYNASLFGIKSDGTALNTGSIQKAIDFISENGGGRLVFYVGRYLTGSIQLKSNVTIQLEEGAVLVGTPSVYDYYGINGTKALVLADGQQNIGITGKGVIEGQGSELLEQINIQIRKGYLKETVIQASPALIALNNCTNITIDQINLRDACGNVQSFNGCTNLSISGVTVKSANVAGSKGIWFSGCDGIKLTQSFFETSGTELSSDGTSGNVSVMNCINANGRKLQVKN